MNWSRTIVKVSGFKTGCIVKTNHLGTWQDLGGVLGITLHVTIACVENRLFFFFLHGLFEAVSEDSKAGKWLEEKQFAGGSRSDSIVWSL